MKCNPTFLKILVLGFALLATQPCILEEVIDRPNLGQKRPLCSKGHYYNLPDRTRTVARVKVLNVSSLKDLVRIGQG